MANNKTDNWKYSISELPETKVYNGVDVVKFVCSILVISIHVVAMSSFSSELARYISFGMRQYIARIAVPFFFTSAGFFLFRKIKLDEFNTAIVMNYVLKILKLFAIWSILIFAGGNEQLWYLVGLVIAVVAVSILMYRGVSTKTMILIAICLYIIGLLGDSYYGLISPLRSSSAFDYICKVYETLWGTTRNGVFFGIPFVLLGGGLC